MDEWVEDPALLGGWCVLELYRSSLLKFTG